MGLEDFGGTIESQEIRKGENKEINWDKKRPRPWKLTDEDLNSRIQEINKKHLEVTVEVNQTGRIGDPRYKEIEQELQPYIQEKTRREERDARRKKDAELLERVRGLIKK